MDEGKFCLKNGLVRRLNDKTSRMEVWCRLRETTGAIILKGAGKAEFLIEVPFLLGTWKRCSYSPTDVN
jgi:hypothetical protein